MYGTIRCQKKQANPQACLPAAHALSFMAKFRFQISGNEVNNNDNANGKWEVVRHVIAVASTSEQINNYNHDEHGHPSRNEELAPSPCCRMLVPPAVYFFIACVVRQDKQVRVNKRTRDV
jgi:hypothetical protein